MSIVANWPGGLPQSMLIEGYSEAPKQNKIITDMEVGVKTERAMFGKVPRVVNCSVKITSAQMATFKTFYETTLTFGISRFGWHLPWDIATTREFKFIGDGYKFTPIVGASLWQLDMDFEVYDP